MARRELRVDMDAILDAIDSHGDPPFYLDLTTGEVEAALDPEVVGDEQIDFDDPRWAAVPQREASDAHGAMVAFAEQVEEYDVRQRLLDALAGRGAFGRFRRVLAEYADLRARWEADEHERLLRQALAWLHGIGIEPRYTLRPPQPSIGGPLGGSPRSERTLRVGLTHMLLLGAPRGKTELIDGRVYRFFVAKDATAARRTFVDVARELTEHAGVGWRNRCVEGRDEYAVAEHRLSVADNVVELAIKVPRTIWDAFSRG